MGRERERPKKLKLGDNLVIELLHKISFLHFSYLPASASEPNCINNLYSKSGLQNGKEFDQLQVPPRKISGKKPDPENPGKIWI